MRSQLVPPPPSTDQKPARDPWWARLADALGSLAWRLLWSWRR